MVWCKQIFLLFLVFKIQNTFMPWHGTKTAPIILIYHSPSTVIMQLFGKALWSCYGNLSITEKWVFRIFFYWNIYFSYFPTDWNTENCLIASWITDPLSSVLSLLMASGLQNFSLFQSLLGDAENRTGRVFKTDALPLHYSPNYSHHTLGISVMMTDTRTNEKHCT